MRFREKLKFFVFGGCFVALGVGLTYLTDIQAEDADLGELKTFDLVVCKDLAIIDNNGNPRMFFSSRETPTVVMTDSEGKTTISLIGGTKKVPPSMVFGELEKIHTEIGVDGIKKRVNETVISRWP